MIAGARSGVVDLRSDTVTRPVPAMREAMAGAEVGDDVYGDDPTVNALQARAAELTGTGAALFVASGTMANQLAIALWARPGDEVLLHAGAHPVHHEAGGAAANSGASLLGLPGEGGIFAEALGAAIRPDTSALSRTALVMVENTHNGAGGRVLPLGATEEIRRIASEAGVPVHLDGARLFNAQVASGVEVARYAAFADTVSFCLSKGLGCPVGSLLCGPAEQIRQARRIRERLGGAWRQAGILAAAGLYALDHHVARLAEDHARARALAEALERTSAWRVPHPVDTNIVYAEATGDEQDAAPAFQRRLAERGVTIGAPGPRLVRLVTHLDVDDADVERAIEAIRAVA